MTTSNQIGMLKEQLRVKSLELKKRDIERTQHENKVQQVIEVSRKKISNLKQEIAEKDKSIRNASSVPIEGSQSKSIVDSTPNSLKEIKLSKGILALRQKNSILTDKLRAEKEKRENSAKEIDRLLEEIQRLQGNSEKTALLKKQLAEMEVEYQHFQKKYKKLLEEKKEILAEYQELQSDRINNRPEVNQELEDQLAFYKAEKGNLELELENNKKLFNKKLADKINKVEEEWRGKTKVLRRQKDRKNIFPENQWMRAKGLRGLLPTRTWPPCS
jgi:chromosome segregation ATPase